MNEEEEQEQRNTILEKLLDPLWIMAIQSQRIVFFVCFFFFVFFFFLYTLNPKNMCTLYTVSNKTFTDVRGSVEQLPQDLGGTTLNLSRLGPSGRIV